MIRIGPEISALVSRDAPLKKWTVIVPCRDLVPVDGDQARTRLDHYAVVDAVNHYGAMTEFFRLYPRYKGRRVRVRLSSELETQYSYTGTFGGRAAI